MRARPHSAPKPPHIKICGITRVEDGRLAQKLGADAIGVIFSKQSARMRTLAQGREIFSSLSRIGPRSLARVGVFVNEDLSRILEVAAGAGLTAVQLHGPESPEFVAALKQRRADLQIIQVIEIGAAFRAEEFREPSGGDALLFDSLRTPGGTRVALEPSRLKGLSLSRPFFIAGGLGADNVRAMVESVAPFGVDVCSGVEREVGIKCEARMSRFFDHLRQFQEGGEHPV